MKKIEKLSILFFFFLLLAVCANYLYQTTPLKHLDTVFLFEATQSIPQTGRPESKSLRSLPEWFASFFVANRNAKDPAQSVCHAPWKNLNLHSYNLLEAHAYYALYPISFLTHLMSPEWIYAILNAAFHLLLIFIPFVFLRKEGLKIIPAFSFSFAIFLYPAWFSSLTGDYYVDRLYMPFALVTLYVLHDILKYKKEKNRLLIFLTLITASFTERATIMMIGMLLFTYLFSFRRSLFFLLLFFAGYLFYYFEYTYFGFNGAGMIRANFVMMLKNPLLRFTTPTFIPFFLVNGLFLGLFIPFAGLRYFLLGLGALMTNVITPIGGASEYIGWTTHYHTMYIPFLIFVATLGYSNFLKYFSHRFFQTAFSLFFIIFTFIVASMLNTSTGKFDEPFLSPLMSSIHGKIFDYYLRPEISYEKQVSALIRTVKEMIPEGVSISMGDTAMPVLYKNRTILIFPENIDEADYIVISGEKNSSPRGFRTLAMINSMQGEKFNDCLMERMDKKNFQLYKSIDPISLLILKKSR